MRAPIAAIALITALAGCEPANESQRLALHWQACQVGLPDARVIACSQVIEAPNVAVAQKVEALIDRGMMRAERDESERAFADFGQALFLDDSSSEAHIQRGLLHQKRGAFGAAIVDFVAADAIDEDSGGADYLTQAINAQAKSYRNQIARLDHAIATTRASATLYNDRCWLRAVLGEDLDGALADCNRALELAPRSAEMLDSRGLVNLKRGDYQAALADYGQAAAEEPQRGHYRYGLGVARFGLGQRAQAQEDWQIADTLEPGVSALYESYGVRLREDN
jgi:tetratricopeptide (TPR) repeat protein